MLEARAAVVREKGSEFSIERLGLEEPLANEVVVRVVGVGVCHTDLIVRDQWYEVPLPAVLGHEGSGVVERVGESVSRVAPGDHVVLSFNYCGVCANCRSGWPSYCADFYARNFGGARPDGSCSLMADSGPVHSHFFGQSSFASRATVAENSVVKVPKDAPLELLGPLGCGVQTGAGAVLNTLKPGPGSSLVVFGTGAVGMSAILAAVASGVTEIIGVDLRPERLELARELGAAHTVDGSGEGVVERIAEITGGGADYALDTTGVPQAFRAAVDALGLRGTCGLIGAPPIGTEVALDMNGVMIPGKRVQGIIEGDSIPDLFIPRLIELHRKGRFPFEKLVKFYDLEEINQAAEDAEAGATIKPVLRVGSVEGE